MCSPSGSQKAFDTLNHQYITILQYNILIHMLSKCHFSDTALQWFKYISPIVNSVVGLIMRNPPFKRPELESCKALFLVHSFLVYI